MLHVELQNFVVAWLRVAVLVLQVTLFLHGGAYVSTCVCVYVGGGGGVAKKNRIFKLMFTEASAEGASL